MFLQSPEAETLWITVVSGDMWRDEEIAHTLRMLEIIGRMDVPVLPGAAFPLINRMEFIERWKSSTAWCTIRARGTGHRPGRIWETAVLGKNHEPFEAPLWWKAIPPPRRPTRTSRFLGVWSTSTRTK